MRPAGWLQRHDPQSSRVPGGSPPRSAASRRRLDYTTPPARTPSLRGRRAHREQPPPPHANDPHRSDSSLIPAGIDEPALVPVFNLATTRGFSGCPLQESANSPASDRTAQKIRRQEQGHQYAEAQLIALGAPVPRAGCNPAVWLREALVAVGARNVRHRGAHRYVWRLGRSRREREQIKLGLPTQRPYPKQPDPEPIAA